MRLRQPTVRTVLSSRIPRLPISFTPRFFVRSLALFGPALVLPSSSSAFPLLAPSLLTASSTSSSPFILLFRFLSRGDAPRTRAHFFSSVPGLSMDDTASAASGGKDAPRRRFSAGLNPASGARGVYRVSRRSRTSARVLISRRFSIIRHTIRTAYRRN